MDESDDYERIELEKSISAWRQPERRRLIDTVEELIATSLKYAKSQYTPSAQRLRWIRLAGQMAWYKDQIMKNLHEEAMMILLSDLEKRMTESETKSQSPTGNYPLIGFPKREDSTAEKARDEATTDTAKAEEPEHTKEEVSSATD